MSKVAVLLTQGFADWEYALIGGTGRPFYGFDVRYFTPVVGEIRSMGGLTANVSQDLDDLAKWQPNAVVVVGRSIWKTDEAPDIRNVLNAQHAGGAVVAGICGGTLALARAGLLDDVRHTSNDPAFLSQNADGYSGAELYIASASAISEDRVITAPGTAPASFTAAVFESVGLENEKVAQFKAMTAAEHA
jgi:putative intracellular protease/amidase